MSSKVVDKPRKFYEDVLVWDAELNRLKEVVIEAAKVCREKENWLGWPKSVPFLKLRDAIQSLTTHEQTPCQAKSTKTT